MDVHASLTELPELKAFLSVFQVRFRRPEGTAALERYMTGLLTELPNKNCDTPWPKRSLGRASSGCRSFLPTCNGTKTT
jgi:hypothetical protein